MPWARMRHLRATSATLFRPIPEKENYRMLKLFIHWILSALTLLVIAHFLHGFTVLGLEPALIAALVIGLLNATLGLVLKIINFPINIIT